VGIFDAHGAVLFANRGMRTLLELGHGNLDAASYFQAPRFARFVEAAESDTPVFAGLLTIGSAASAGVTLRGRVFHRKGQVLIICEHDVAGLASANRQQATLLAEVSNLQRELIKEKRALTDANRQLEQLNEKLRRSEEDLRRALQMRDEVLGVVAHDLRAPLSTIALQAAVFLSRGPLSETRRRRAAESISRGASRMQHLIRDLLDVARIEAGALRIQRAPASPAELVIEAVDGQRLLGDSAEVRFEVDLDRRLPAVWGDRDRLLQVLDNLIGNAMKFTPPGGHITIGAASREDQVLFWVRDTGGGIAPEKLAHVFDRFWQAAEHTGRLGAGLGLAISKGIIDAHGGKIWVESAPGRGSTFFFSVPIAGSETTRPVDTMH
jgi:signal transduction histidine kinase